MFSTLQKGKKLIVNIIFIGYVRVAESNVILLKTTFQAKAEIYVAFLPYRLRALTHLWFPNGKQWTNLYKQSIRWIASHSSPWLSHTLAHFPWRSFSR